MREAHIHRPYLPNDMPHTENAWREFVWNALPSSDQEYFKISLIDRPEDFTYRSTVRAQEGRTYQFDPSIRAYFGEGYDYQLETTLINLRERGMDILSESGLEGYGSVSPQRLSYDYFVPRIEWFVKGINTSLMAIYPNRNLDGTDTFRMISYFSTPVEGVLDMSYFDKTRVWPHELIREPGCGVIILTWEVDPLIDYQKVMEASNLFQPKLAAANIMFALNHMRNHPNIKGTPEILRSELKRFKMPYADVLNMLENPEKVYDVLLTLLDESDIQKEALRKEMEELYLLLKTLP